jgi:hypothetical protein
MKTEIIVTNISKQEFEDLLYKYTRIANDQLYKGLVNHIFRIEDRLGAMEETLEYLKLSQQTQPRTRKKKVVDE